MTKRHRTVHLLLSCGLILSGGFYPVDVVVRAENPDHVKQLRETHQCPGCDLADAQLSGLIAELANLKGADLTRAVLYKARLRGADLTGASLNGANLSGADLRNTKGANLAGATTDETTLCPSGANGPC